MKTMLFCAIASLSVAAPAFAESTRLATPIQAGSLHTGALDMSAYRVDLPDGGYEVTATFRGRTHAEPQRVVMRLEDQDEVRFSMPDDLQTIYTFSRAAGVVEISAEGAAEQLASR